MTARPLEELLLFPCNGNATEALDCLGERYRAIGFIDDDPRKVGSRVLGIPVFDRTALERFPTASVLSVPGSPTSFSARAGLIASLGVATARFATVIHPTAAISRHAQVGMNVLIMAGTVVTANAIIEDHVVILPNAVIHHDARIETYSIIGAGVLVAGSVRVGRHCYIGSGARLRNDITVAPATLVGLGATVLASIAEPGGVWVGTPARPLRSAVTG